MASRSFSERALISFYTEQPLHCGAETGTGYVDMPVQREKHTGFPLIPGSTIKGVFRDELETKVNVAHYFGADDASTAGRVSFGDAFVVAFPVRSSGVPFRWVTCPQVLERLYRAQAKRPPRFNLAAGTGWTAAAGRVLLDEIAVTAAASTDLGEILDAVSALLPSDDSFAYTREILRDRLTVVADADFGMLVETGTEIVTRIRLNDKGTTTGDGGNMFNQEIVPRDTLFLSVLREVETSAGERFPLNELPKVMRLGGDESIGRGVVWLRCEEIVAAAARKEA